MLTDLTVTPISGFRYWPCFSVKCGDAEELDMPTPI